MKLYTKTICPKCLWVKSELEEANLQAEIINIDHQEDALLRVKEAGFSSVPLLELNGEWIAEVPHILQRIQALAK